jgi:hypothetical protein
MRLDPGSAEPDRASGAFDQRHDQRHDRDDQMNRRANIDERSTGRSR